MCPATALLRRILEAKDDLRNKIVPTVTTLETRKSEPLEKTSKVPKEWVRETRELILPWNLSWLDSQQSQVRFSTNQPEIL